MPSPGMSVVPSECIRTIPGGEGFFGPLVNVRAGSFTWRTKVSHVEGVQLCSVGGLYPCPVWSGLFPCHVTT